MNLSIEFSAEETAALQAELDARNTANGTGFTIEDKMVEVMRTEALQAAERQKEAGAARVAEEWKAKPYEERAGELGEIAVP